MKRIEFINDHYERFFNQIERNDFTESKQITAFVKWCFEHGFLDNLTRDDLEQFYEYPDKIYLPFFKNHRITIVVDYWDNYCRLYIDPTSCFDKPSKCSIVMKLPMTKRDEKAFYKLLDSILDTKSHISKEWFKNAAESFYGSYMSN